MERHELVPGLIDAFVVHRTEVPFPGFEQFGGDGVDTDDLREPGGE